MRRRSLFVLALGASIACGCEDGQSPGNAACETGAADSAIDLDGDGLRGDSDPCPFDPELSGDNDGDGVADACDPFPLDAGDTRRCVTAFADPAVSARYLAARPGETAWNLAAPLTALSTQTVSMVSLLDPGFAVTTFDVSGSLSFPTATASARFVLWLQTVNAPSSADLGCAIDGTNSVYVLAGGERVSPRPLTGPTTAGFRLRAVVQQQPSGNTVLCRVTVGATSVTSLHNIPVVGGAWGLAATNADVMIDGLVIDSRNDVRPL